MRPGHAAGVWLLDPLNADPSPGFRPRATEPLAALRVVRQHYVQEQEAFMARPETTTALSATEDSIAELSRQIDALRADVAAITQTIGTIGREGSHAAAERVRSEAARLAAKGGAELAALQAQAERAGEEAADMVRRQPAMAMGLAAALGFVAGLLTARR
jgi:ElaB/YqjD/DUF883 family membrane-anchored ribosome-binding protein